MAFDPSSYPYSAIVYIRDTIGGQNFQASGVLLSPDEVLTASHVVYTSGVGTATNIVVTPGYNAGASPYGSATASYFHYFSIHDVNGSLSFTDSQTDYAIIHLSHPIAAAGAMGLLANYTGGTVHSTGYPASGGGRMTDVIETVTQDPFFTLLDGIDTGSGSSGSPLWIFGSDGLPYVVGSVSGGNASTNKGYNTQVTTTVYNQIKAWIAQDDGVNNQISGTAANDIFTAGGANSTFTGNGGHDTLVFHGAWSSYTITVSGTAVTATDTAQNRDGVTQTIGVEYLQFTDRTTFVENADNANIARLYAAALGRLPDTGGMSYWENIYTTVSPAAKASGAIVALAETDIAGTLTSIAAGFTGSNEFQQKYGSLSDAAFITQLYLNVLSRAPDTGGYAYWTDAIHSGQTHEMVLVGFAESAESAAKIASAGWLLTV